jgi:hypothetical protein
LRAHPGLLELSSSAGFSRPECLTALTGLTSLAARLVPLPAAEALPRLPALRVLALVQSAPLTSRQAAALAGCRGLTAVEVEPLPWELLPSLGGLARLRALSVRLHQPPRGALPMAAADALLSLAPLERLQAFALAGRLELGARHVAALAAAWPRLRGLDLCCGLAAGTAGFSALRSLRRLRLSPHYWDVWSSEAPLLLHPAELPPGLTCLEARDVWVVPPAAAAAGAGPAGAAPAASAFSWDGSESGGGGRRRSSSSAASSSTASLESLGGGSGAAEPASPPHGCLCGSVMSVAGCICGSGDSSSGGGGGFGGALGRVGSSGRATPVSRCSSASSLEEDSSAAASAPAGASEPELTTAREPAPAPSAPPPPGDALALSTPRLRRLVLRCVGAPGVGGASVRLPGLGALTALHELDLHHSHMTAAELEALTSAPAAASLRALRLVIADDSARVAGGALAKLTHLTALESLQVRGAGGRGGGSAPSAALCARQPFLEHGSASTHRAAPAAPTPTPPSRPSAPPCPQVHAHERALNRRVRAAIASMASLRRLTLVTSPDCPGRFASGLLVLTRLRRLAVLRVGLGFGAVDALRRLRASVGRALPGCRFEMLADVDRLMEEEEGPAGIGSPGAGPGRGRGGAAGPHGVAGLGKDDGLLLGGAGGKGLDGGDDDDGDGDEAALALLAPAAAPGGAGCGGGAVSAADVAAARVHGPRYVRLVRASWGG